MFSKFLILFSLCTFSVLPSLPFIVQHNKNIHVSGGIIFVRSAFYLFLSVLFIHCVLSYHLSLCHLFLYNTNVHAACGIRTRNPSKRSAADPRLRPLVHRDRLFPISQWNLFLFCSDRLIYQSVQLQCVSNVHNRIHNSTDAVVKRFCSLNPLLSCLLNYHFSFTCSNRVRA
jgi:hypothetical protein